MKRKLIIALLLTMAMALSIMFPSCAKKASTLEEVIKSNTDISEQIQSTAEQANMEVTIEKNTVNFKFDLSKTDGASEETVKDPVVQETLVQALDAMKPNFAQLCKSIEDETEISGVEMVVSITFGDEVLATQTFTSAE